MKRRDFSFALSTTAALSGAAQLSPALAQARKFEDGADFVSLEKRAVTEAPAGKVEVVEFFWYSCPHCHAFEPKLEVWLKNIPKDVAVRRVPVAFRDDFVPQQRLFFVLEAMNRLHDLHAKVFYAVHVEKNPLNREDSIAGWAERQGLDRTKFLEMYNSFSVTTKANKARQLQDAYKIDGVPALGVGGRYLTSGSMAQNMDRALLVTDYLIAEARKAK
jgi:thiol:disulfide interchange protein DsbA